MTTTLQGPGDGVNNLFTRAEKSWDFKDLEADFALDTRPRPAHNPW